MHIVLFNGKRSCALGTWHGNEVIGGEMTDRMLHQAEGEEMGGYGNLRGQIAAEQ